jgi:hypothetical protein
MADLPWRDVEIGAHKVAIFQDYPGHFYALDPASGAVVSGPTHEAVVARLERPTAGTTPRRE